MPIYEDRKIILVHVIKTGGTALDQLLSFDKKKESRRVNMTKVKLRQALGLPVIGKHSCALDYKKYLKEDYANYYKVAFVRNPWDWLVSLYEVVMKVDISPDTGIRWRHALYTVVSNMSFYEFVEWVTQKDGFKDLAARRMSVFNGKTPVLQKDWLSDESGKIIVDFIGRFETLSEDIDSALSGHGVNSAGLQVVNKTARKPYESYYNELSIEMVGDYFREDIEAFGYEF